jgi:hypothetical protein
MVEPLHTHVAIVAVRSPWRPEDIARITELYPKVVRLHLQSVYPFHVLHPLIQVTSIDRYSAGPLRLVPRQYFGNHPRVRTTDRS